MFRWIIRKLLNNLFDMPSFLEDYCYYSSGNETPEKYLYWGGLSILGHLLGHKVAVMHGDYFRFTPQLFINIVGEAGSGKNTALTVNKKIMRIHFPEWLLSASIQSREDIAYQMSGDECIRTYKDNQGKIIDYRPFYILNNEFASFLSQDLRKMIEFLVEVYDGDDFSTGFKTDRKENPKRQQWFSRPHVSVLAGAVPTWFMNSLRMDLFTGGLGRRMIIVYETRTKICPFPRKPPGADLAMGRVIEHLKKAEAFTGELRLNEKAQLWWRDWYKKEREDAPQDPIIGQFHQTKPMQVLKIATLLKMSEVVNNEPLDDAHLAAANALFNNLMEPIKRLTSGIGRNELAGIGAQILDFISRMGGMVSEIKLKVMFRRYLQDPEFLQVLNSYVSTKELLVLRDDTKGVTYYMTPEGYEQYQTALKQRLESKK